MAPTREPRSFKDKAAAGGHTPPTTDPAGRKAAEEAERRHEGGAHEISQEEVDKAFREKGSQQLP